MSPPRRHRRVVAALGLALGAALLPAAPARAAESLPKELAEVGVTEHLGGQVPLELTFTDHRGQRVRLGDYFRDGKPVILTLNYYSCAMLCGLQLNGLLKGMKGLNWSAGDQYRVVTVSIDPREDATLAGGKRRAFLGEYGRPHADWSFLVGEEANIKRLAQAVGFGYRYDAATKQYAHPAVLYVLSPKGKIDRYLYGIEYRPSDLKFSLMEASQGRTASTVDKLILSCFHYDADRHQYGPYAFGIMRLGGGLTLAILAVVLLVLWRRERRRGPGGPPPAVPTTGAAAGVGAFLLGLGPQSGPILPPAASTSADAHDALFHFILAVTAFFFFLVVALLVLFVVRYRKRREGQRTSGPSHNLRLEIAWSVVPAILMIVFFAWGYREFLNLSVPPANSLEVRVTGQKWSWSFEYPKDGINVTKDLVVPAGRPVKLTMSSVDVIHGFYIPAFRVKRDVLPNRYTVVWFQAKDPGEYDLFCTQFCGTGHASMHGKIIVKKEAEFREWVESGGGLSGKGMSSVDFGRMLFDKQGCVTCHSVDGTPRTGPSLLNRYGRLEQLADGKSVLMDDNYIRESLMDPSAKVVKGYQSVMPTYRGRLKDQQINALVDYIKSLKRE
jgi:cytochrome c oxidase subunit 2